MRTPKVSNCQDCTAEFDGATDSERFYIDFCPLHKNAEHLKRALEVIRDRTSSQTERTFINMILGPVEQQPVDLRADLKLT